MKILILEDNPERIAKMKQLFYNQELFIFDNVIESFNVCKKLDFEICFLDHDLDGRIWVDSSEENTGYQFVKMIVENNIGKDALIYIHSCNPIGANKMLNLLKDYNYDGIHYPFRLWKI